MNSENARMKRPSPRMTTMYARQTHIHARQILVHARANSFDARTFVECARVHLSSMPSAHSYFLFTGVLSHLPFPLLLL